MEADKNTTGLLSLVNTGPLRPPGADKVIQPDSELTSSPQPVSNSIATQCSLTVYDHQLTNLFVNITNASYVSANIANCRQQLPVAIANLC